MDERQGRNILDWDRTGRSGKRPKGGAAAGPAPGDARMHGQKLMGRAADFDWA